MAARMSFVASLLVPLALSMPAGVAQSSPPIVPGAAGFGMQTRAAYACGTNPAVYRVTNLNDTGDRFAAGRPHGFGPASRHFRDQRLHQHHVQHQRDKSLSDRSGANGPLARDHECGWWAAIPPKRGFVVGAHDTLWQHFRIRPGDGTCNSGIQFWNFNNSSFDVYNNVLDHVSISWAQDEGVVLVTTPHDSTVWRSIVAEILIAAPGSSDCTGGGISTGNGVLVGRGKNIAILQNLSRTTLFVALRSAARDQPSSRTI